MIERQIQKFMEKNTDFIAKFVANFMEYEFEDTGYSLKVVCKMGMWLHLKQRWMMLLLVNTFDVFLAEKKNNSCA